MRFFVYFIHLRPTTNKRMRNILIIGAGRSASSLIQYLLHKSTAEQLHLTIGDLSLELAQRKTNNHPNATAIALDIHNVSQRQAEIQKADIVISMLPAHMHIDVAKDCVTFKKNMVTASYISDAMQSLDEEAKANNLIFMNEIGLDPGIDHMSAMKLIDHIHAQGGTITSFKSPREPSMAYFHAFSMSSSVLITDCPLPELDINGFTTHGIPVTATPAFNSSKDVA